MATTFNGWGDSWAQTWTRITDPNAMYGSATIRFTATGTLTGAATTAVPAELPRYSQSLAEIAFWQQVHEEDELLLTVLQHFVMEA